MNILDGLNEAQYEAVTVPDGPTLVLAGPGSGKTRVLTYRIAYLIQARRIAPWRIMAVTFTNKAAREMRERIEVLIGENLRGLLVGTFHATCARILRLEADSLPDYTRDFVIFDSDDQKQAVKQAMADLNIDDKRYNPNKMRNGISAAKNALITPREYQAKNYIGEMIGRIYRRYQEILIANNAMDFDDLLMNAVLLFDRAPDVLARYQQQYQHILIDEFQDTNLTQYGLIKQLAGHGNVFAVGDADQSIYKWRGADIRNLQRLRQDFPEAQEILLEQNYRSTQIILDAAKEVIRQNQNRVHKELFTQREGGEPIVVREAYNDLDEADQVIMTIQSLMLDGYSAGDCAVMYRTNAQSRVLEEAFIGAGIPYKLVGATRFYARREIKDVVAYLRVIHNPADEFSFGRIVNVPRRGIGRKTQETLRAWALQNGWQPGEAVVELATRPELQHPFSGRAYNVLKEFGDMLHGWIEMRATAGPIDILDTVLDEIGYQEYLDDGTEQGEERWENVREFRSVAILAEGLTLSQFLEEVALVSEVDNLDEEANAATLLTLHAAKGLEFPVVFLVGLEDGLLPHSRSLSSDDREDLAEERRLFYVGLTRAKDRIYISHAFQRLSWGSYDVSAPSRFLGDLPGHLIEGGSAGQRRAESKARASSWHWEAGGSSGRATESNRTRSPSNDNQERYGPKTRRTDSAIPERDKALPRPNAALYDEYETEPDRPTKTTPDFKTGQTVRHAKFGQGIVVESKITGADEEVTVAFSEHGIKRLAASMARLEKVED